MNNLPELYESTNSAAAVLKVLAASGPGIGPDRPQQMRAAFNLSLPELKSIGGWSPDGAGELDDTRLDAALVPAVERLRVSWDVR